MSENTKIEWADHTFNPWTGCTKVSPACDHCYAEAWSKRAGAKVGKWGPGAVRVRTTKANWQMPLKWNAQAEREGRRFRVFCASLADVFDNEVPAQWQRDLFELIAATPHLDWLLLTKRIGNARAMLNEVVDDLSHGINTWDELPWPGVWIGATVCNQLEADRDIPKLLATPAAVRFLSIEPMLGPIELGLQCENWSDDIVMDPETGARDCCRACDYTGIGNAIDWVICGGESGSGARPMHPDWARSLRDQCAATGVPFLFKQWGEWSPGDVPEAIDAKESIRIEPSGSTHPWPPAFYTGRGDWCMHRVGKKAAGRLLDGVEHNGFPGGAA